MLWVLIRCASPSDEYHSMCFHGEIRKISLFSVTEKKKCLIWSYECYDGYSFFLITQFDEYRVIS